MDNSNTKGKISITDNVSSDINLMLEQIKYLHNELNSIQSSFLTLISISLGAYGLVIFYALNYGSQNPKSVNYLFIVLPFLFFLSFYNIIKYTIKMLIKCLYHGFSVEYWCNKISKNYSIDIEFKTRAPFWYIKLKDKFKKEVECDDGDNDSKEGNNDIC